MLLSELQATAYPPYYGTYISALGEGDLVGLLEKGRTDFLAFLDAVPVQRLSYAYAPEKWTLAEVLVHIMDTERIFHYRALRIARSDLTDLPGFDQDAYVPHSRAMGRKLGDIRQEYASVRDATISLFKSFDRETLDRMGRVNGHPTGVGAIGFIICGHQAHHLGIIGERYLS